jgi:hypothetical protein
MTEDLRRSAVFTRVRLVQILSVLPDSKSEP